MSLDDIIIFAGSSSKGLTASICQHLGVAPGKGEVITFSEGNTFVRVLENVRGREVYIVQSTIFPANDSFMELLFWIDAFKRASADSVTVIFSINFKDQGDIVLGKVFLQEFQDCRRSTEAPPRTWRWSRNSPPEPVSKVGAVRLRTVSPARPKEPTAMTPRSRSTRLLAWPIRST